MPLNPNKELKRFYSIAEVGEIFNVPPTTLRYWEKEFDMIKPNKNKKGDRFFTTKDIETIRTIYYLTKVKGYTLQGAKDALKNNFAKEAGNAMVVETLTKIKNKLLEIKQEL